MKIGVIADDFTGASDIALTLAEAGARTTQYIGVPSGSAEVDAAVVALKSRTAPVPEAVADSLAVCDWLIGQGAQQIVFKVCSTFDSTPEGNIGPVLDALADRLGAARTLVCPAFPETGRSVYMGHLFVGDRLLNESGMQDHPLTPMTDPDLRRWLGLQSGREIGHVPAGIVAEGPDAICAALPEAGHVIVDAIHDADLVAIGQAAKGMALLCGGSGIALGLPANFGIKAAQPNLPPVTGPGVVLSGSCSIATRGQVAAFTGPRREITAEAVMAGDITAQALDDWVLAQETPPLVYSSADPAIVRAAQERFGREVVADRIEALFSETAHLLAENGVTRIVAAGGETSGAIVSGLNAKSLSIGPRIAAGVPLVHADGVALALKSGNFGGPDFFAEALAMMESGSRT
ncbi:3-oxo-tetronate kinase [Gymnodinialimonas sp. 2305UL16-5]|uniref:3-oxo-tetronate kinase n=1 Tax=Gymnodinialimonas mytili TaxID=3126503 RepID=UPI00309F6783